MKLFVQTNRADLKDNDPWCRLVQDVAKAADHKINAVYFAKNPCVDSFPGIGNSVELTPALITKMTPDEVRVIVAMTIAKIRSIPKLPIWLIVIAGTFAWSSITYGLALALVKLLHLSDHSSTLSTIIGGCGLSIWFWSRTRPPKRVTRADRLGDKFAIELTGDPEFVIATIEKQASLNRAISARQKSNDPLASENYVAMRAAAIRVLTVPSDWARAR